MWTKSAQLCLPRLKSGNYHTITRCVRQVQSASYLHNPGSEPLTIATLGDVISESAHKHPGRVAIRSIHENINMTYEELLTRADALGCAFRDQGLVKGDRVGVWSHNSSAWVVAVVAAARAGLISVLLNPVYTKHEIMFCLNKTKAKSLFIGERLPNRSYYDILETLAPELKASTPGQLKSELLPDLTSVISVGKEKLHGTFAYDTLIRDYRNRNEISQYGSEVKPDDGCMLLLTSGTTGEPKAALDSHNSIVNNTYFSGKRLLFNEGHQNVCVQAPLFHALGAIVTAISALRHGCTMVLASPTYDVTANINALLAEKCTVITGTPTMYVDMLARLRSAGDVQSHLKIALAAGSPCSPQLIRDMGRVLKADVKALYGLSETTACVFHSKLSDDVDKVAETVGYITDHIELKVVDGNGSSVPFGCAGELMVRGYSTMMCYYNEPEKTRKAFDKDGWLYTGDKFTISEDGYGRVVGRLKDIIVRGGENIAPKEIEDLLNTHPDVIDNQVIGLSDERLGEELCVVVRLHKDAKFTIEDVKKHLTGRLAKFKIPRIMKVIEEFPKTASGKIQKYRLKEMIEDGEL